MPYKYHANFIKISCKSQVNILEISWKYPPNTMQISYKFYAYLIKISCKSHANFRHISIKSHLNLSKISGKSPAQSRHILSIHPVFSCIYKVDPSHNSGSSQACFVSCLRQISGKFMKISDNSKVYFMII